MTKILLAEDDPGVALGIGDDLELEGYQVEAAADGELAARRARETAFDLIVLDLMLPRKDGFTVCRELRRAGIKTPVIMLTARTQEAEKVLGLELGADDYVTKPFSSLELRARIKAVLRRTAPDGAALVRFGEVEVDMGSCQVRRGGHTIEMTATEFKVLSVFLKRSGRLLTREQILDEVWGKDSSPTDRVIDNHIMNLRRKIEPKPDEPRFLTSVRGLGYRFDG
ncbi:MAG: response regulator transcription factor [Bryobacterales bacterium]|nr:response regulator transcription factor [Bryobacterales bacterium]